MSNESEISLRLPAEGEGDEAEDEPDGIKTDGEVHAARIIAVRAVKSHAAGDASE